MVPGGTYVWEGCGNERQDGSALTVSASVAGKVGNREKGRGLSAGPKPAADTHPGQDTHLLVPRLLLRNRRAICMTSSVRLQVAWSVFLPRGSRVRAAFSLGPRALRLQAGPQHQAEEVWVAWPAHLPTWPPAPARRALTGTSAAPEASAPAQPAGPVPAVGPGSRHPTRPENTDERGQVPHPPHPFVYPPSCHAGAPLTLAVL